MSSATDLPGPVQEIQKRAAKVNTQLRFKKHDEALKLALELRLHIQTCGYEHPAVEDELKGVEAAIRQLERRRFGYYRYLTQLFLKALFDAFRTKSAEQSDDAASSADADAVVPQAEQVEAEAINPARMARDDGAVNPAQMAAQQNLSPAQMARQEQQSINPAQMARGGDEPPTEQLPPGAPRM